MALVAAFGRSHKIIRRKKMDKEGTMEPELCINDAPNEPKVLLLNADYRPLRVAPLSVINWQDALRALMLDRVRVVEQSPYVARSPNAHIRIPKTIALKRYLHVSQLYDAAPCTPRNIFIRDMYTCMYTGVAVQARHNSPRYRASVDHFYLPRSVGGTVTWNNVLTVSAEVNSRKSNMTPRQFEHKTGMKALVEPWVPTKMDIFILSLAQERVKPAYPSWWQFLEVQGVSDQVKRVLDAFGMELQPQIISP